MTTRERSQLTQRWHEIASAYFEYQQVRHAGDEEKFAQVEELMRKADRAIEGFKNRYLNAAEFNAMDEVIKSFAPDTIREYFQEADPDFDDIIRDSPFEGMTNIQKISLWRESVRKQYGVSPYDLEIHPDELEYHSDNYIAVWNHKQAMDAYLRDKLEAYNLIINFLSKEEWDAIPTPVLVDLLAIAAKNDY